ncbi:putative pyridoxal 5'-phosphate synthase subunit PdxS/SNZ [Helianthus debilis subsp. tardiflorus]
MDEDEVFTLAKELGAPYDIVVQSKQLCRLLLNLCFCMLSLIPGGGGYQGDPERCDDDRGERARDWPCSCDNPHQKLININ